MFLSWGGDALEGSLGTDVPLSPSNPEHVEDKMIRSFRVCVTQSPTRQFSLSSRNGPPVLGEDINTIEALQALRVISVKFLLVISLLYKTEWS